MYIFKLQLRKGIKYTYTAASITVNILHTDTDTTMIEQYQLCRYGYITTGTAVKTKLSCVSIVNEGVLFPEC